jgi:hypothetical protein
MAIFGPSVGPSHRIYSQKPINENEHNSHGHFLMFDVYGTNFPHKALAFCVHLFSSIFLRVSSKSYVSLIDFRVKCRKMWMTLGLIILTKYDKNSKKLQNGNFEGRF